MTIERRTDDKGKQKREIAVDQIRQMVFDAVARPQTAEHKVYVVRDAQLMNTAAQNAALKLLEEPPASAAFILCAANTAMLLPTVPPPFPLRWGFSTRQDDPADLPPVPRGPAAVEALTAWAAELRQAARTADHPFQPGLALEAQAARALKALHFAPPPASRP